jgi:hypothetical protein
MHISEIRIFENGVTMHISEICIFGNGLTMHIAKYAYLVHISWVTIQSHEYISTGTVHCTIGSTKGFVNN